MSKHFSWDEVIHSSTARIKGINNELPFHLKSNVLRTMEHMEEVRKLLGGQPLYVNSWFRCPELNKAVGGSKTSAHMKGMAVDFEHPHLARREVFQRLALSNIPFDQLIHEGTKDGMSDWMHIGFTNGRPRKQIMTGVGEQLGGKFDFARYHVTTG